MRWGILLALAGCVAARDIGDGSAPDAPFFDDRPDEDEPVDTEPDASDTDCQDDDEDGYACDDCDDSRAEVHPGADEACDGLDSDCVGGPHPGEALVDGLPACHSCAAGGFWPATRDATDGAELYARLKTAASSNTWCDYGDSTRYLFTELDKAGGLVTCVYTGFAVTVGNDKPDPDIMNVEHTWPKSLGGGEVVRECDLHHLFPTTTASNTSRANFPLRPVVAGVTWEDGGSRLGDDATGEVVFEPRDAHKGNAARALMYMALRYDLPLTAADWTLYRQWHADDPPDAREVDRTLAIHDFQGNSNPFVACPATVDAVTTP